MDAEGVEDSVLDSFVDIIIDELTTVSRIPPTDLYFDTCELCVTLDRSRRFERLTGCDAFHEFEREDRASQELPRTELQEIQQAVKSPEMKLEPGPPRTTIPPRSPLRMVIAVNKPQHGVLDWPQKSGASFEGESCRAAAIPKSSECDWCGRRFSNPYHIRRHIICVHMNIRAYACEICQRSFKRRHHLTKHLLTHEQKYRIERVPSSGREPSSDCTLCRIRSRKRDCQRKHLYTTEENNRLICFACKRKVPIKPSQKDELICEKPHRCPCGRCYEKWNSFSRHSKRCLQKPPNFEAQRWSLRLTRTRRVFYGPPPEFETDDAT